MIFHKLWRQSILNIRSRFILIKIISRNCQSLTSSMELSEVVRRLKNYAPLSLAETWDNVGLLVQPSTQSHLVESIFLTNDLTENVIEEAVKKNANMIISYHPPIFVPLKSLTKASWKQRVILKAIENKIAIYSPHTAFDSVKGGINDWLASGLGKGTVEPLELKFIEDERHRVNVLIFKERANISTSVEKLVDKIKEVGSINEVDIFGVSGNDIYINFNCNSGSLLAITRVLNEESPELLKRTNIFNLAKVPIEDAGVGRLCTLEQPVSVKVMLEGIKAHLKLKNIRFASAHPKSTDTQEDLLVKTVALCAGSGASVLKGVKADMYLTGEMSHHEVLDAVSKGIHVVLCEHSNTERGFFVDKFKDVLYDMLDAKIQVLISDEDADPIVIV